MRRLGLLLALAALGMGADAFAQSATGVNEQSTITVEGTGKSRAKPDMATVTIGVVTKNKSAAAAVEENNQRMSDLLALLRQSGIAERDIQTTGFSVNPDYVYDRSGETPPRIAGYTVTNQVSVTVRQLSALGELLDKTVQTGANRIQGVAFSSSDPSALLDEARRKAVDDAQHRAEVYAKAAGLTIGAPLSIQEQGTRIPSPVYLGRELQASGATAAVPIAPGEQTYTAQITVVYSIENASPPAPNPTQPAVEHNSIVLDRR